LAEGKEEIYSIMFSSLKHPVRRKILRVLSDKPLTFSDMLDLLGISSSNLTYHLDNLGELISKGENGVYHLSTFGKAAVSTMQIVEDAPQVQNKKRNGKSTKWQIVTSALLICVIVLVGLSALQLNIAYQATTERDGLQSKYDQLLSWSSTTDNAIEFLQKVVELDTTKYQATLLDRTVETKDNLGGVTEETMHYALSGTDVTGANSKLSITFRFRNGEFSRYQLIVDEGSPIYANPQSPFMIDAARNVVERLRTYETGAYLNNMTEIMAYLNSDNTNTPNGIKIQVGNISLNATASGHNAEVLMEYTENGVDFSPKSVDIVMENGILKSLTDDWNLFTIGSTDVKISSERVVTLARNALVDYHWTYNGQLVSGFKYNSDPAGVIFHPNTKNGLELYPQWTVTFYLDKVYAGGVYMISVQIWADTGEVAKIQPLNSPQSFSI
jgi:hypothetical protein